MRLSALAHRTAKKEGAAMLPSRALRGAATALAATALVLGLSACGDSIESGGFQTP